MLRAFGLDCRIMEASKARGHWVAGRSREYRIPVWVHQERQAAVVGRGRIVGLEHSPTYKDQLRPNIL